MNTKVLWSVALFGTVAAFFTACGDGDSTKIKICNATAVSCINDRGGEICSADGTVRLPFDCGNGQHCCDPKKEDCKDSAGKTPEKASCVGDCTPGATECGSTAVSLVCDTDGRSWLSIECPAGTGCDDDENSDTYGTCVHTDETPLVQVCTKGQTDCAGGGILKTCEEDGSNWVYSQCASNEDCVVEGGDGAAGASGDAKSASCVLNPEKGCEPHSGTCVDLTHLKMCSDDGKTYEADLVECPDGTTCEDGACQGPVCTVGAVRCDDVRVGNSYINAVADGTYQPRALYTCNADGTGWEIVTCAATEICVYDNISVNTVNSYLEALKTSSKLGSTDADYPVLEIPASAIASCQTPGCAAPFVLREIFGNSSLVTAEATAGSFMCGDATDLDNLDPEGSFSLCEGLPPFNNLHWANYLCTAPEICTYKGGTSNSEESYNFIVGPSCSTACIPGAKACFIESNSMSGGVGGIVSTTGESTITCGKDGTYDFGTVAKCQTQDKNKANRELWCGPNMMGTDSFDVGTCMEPACAAWFGVYDTFSIPQDVGACGTDGKFYPCKPDGTFGDPQTCSECMLANGSQLPQVTGLDETFAGYEPGTCVTCTDKAAACLLPSDNATPYYQVCNKGKLETKTCGSGQLCTTFYDPDTALSSVVCGAACKPYTAQCGGVDGKQIRNCDEDGNLPEEFSDCAKGACHSDIQNAGAADAYCEAECITGSVTCGPIDTDGDGEIDGTGQIKCNNKSRFEAADGTECDTTDLAALEKCVDKVGCVQCDPGTFSGIPEVRCAVDEYGVPLAEDPAVQVCKGGKWDKAIACPAGDDEVAVCNQGQGTASCSTISTGAGGTGGAGGTVGVGGSLSVGGSIGVGGTIGVGGSVGVGGSIGVGGTIGVGGAAAFGGTAG